MDEVRGGGSYNSSNDTRIHFGLESSVMIDKIEVRWPSGSKQEFLHVDADACYEINEERGLSKMYSFTVASK